MVSDGVGFGVISIKECGFHFTCTNIPLDFSGDGGDPELKDEDGAVEYD